MNLDYGPPGGPCVTVDKRHLVGALNSAAKAARSKKADQDPVVLLRVGADGAASRVVRPHSKTTVETRSGHLADPVEAVVTNVDLIRKMVGTYRGDRVRVGLTEDGAFLSVSDTSIRQESRIRLNPADRENAPAELFDDLDGDTSVGSMLVRDFSKALRVASLPRKPSAWASPARQFRLQLIPTPAGLEVVGADDGLNVCRVTSDGPTLRGTTVVRWEHADMLCRVLNPKERVRLSVADGRLTAVSDSVAVSVDAGEVSVALGDPRGLNMSADLAHRIANFRETAEAAESDPELVVDKKQLAPAVRRSMTVGKPSEVLIGLESVSGGLVLSAWENEHLWKGDRPASLVETVPAVSVNGGGKLGTVVGKKLSQLTTKMVGRVTVCSGAPFVGLSDEARLGVIFEVRV